MSSLFDGDGQMFARLLADASVYGEYGMGASTLWALANTRVTVQAVDTSVRWVDEVVSKATDRTRLHATWVDLGPIGDWGWPKTYARRDRFANYIQAVWSDSVKPDVVLIDGRFRVCTFLHSLLTGAAGTHILFDDYADRPWYHVVEDFVAPVEKHGRQALFVVPRTFDREAAALARQHFLYVMN
ncbi:hypothetical protein [Devosia sp. CN2-171]|jgi:hypothetical protein|uniref:hypothetical protein n=1 Tax=Devosia sp. CN2-171 TaxID=3400909 RepID=UPI003BF8FEF4